ncbi:glycosyltransferase family 39 protein [Synechococcus sp. CS-1332]|uniref:ArnT family glycosyltransferase n=1 Tax=Synechococcus sp. CS-1332 TaxID=2847972 RepID=UPI00223ABA1A|nr:glycosyltransferase family 39 protein [Synechococcus sp. CS-1332]MCT0208861.1 glycosyltransferase family 39 protein [Synechococcus sp. CS-1332]
MKALWATLPFLPLLLTAAPRSFLAHDEGYYALQARWIAQSGQWLAPPWWDQVVFDRTIGLPWLIAAAYRLLGVGPWVAHVPSLVAAVASLLLTAALARRLLGGEGVGWLAAAVLALTPLWLDYAHLASQDMPLLALELLGLLALLRAGDTPQRHWTLLAGAWIGPAVLIKGFMVALPVLALLPFALLERRPVLRRPAFWLGLALGWLPVALWLGLSLRELGLPVVAGLWQKLHYLSQSDVYSAGPLYYLWNLPANTFPWCLFALAGWRGWLGTAMDRSRRLLLLLYPLLMLLLLSAFRTKTPYYGLQLTPFVALAATAGLRSWSSGGHRSARWASLGLGGLGMVLLLAAAVVLSPGAPAGRLVANGVASLAPTPEQFALAAGGLGLAWALVPWCRSSSRRLGALLIGPWLALVLLVQAGLFTDRSPLQRQALARPEAAMALAAGPIAAAAGAPLSGEEHAGLILVALASPSLIPRIGAAERVPAGERVWIRRQELPTGWPVRLQAPELEPWVLAEASGAGR